MSLASLVVDGHEGINHESDSVTNTFTKEDKQAAEAEVFVTLALRTDVNNLDKSKKELETKAHKFVAHIYEKSADKYPTYEQKGPETEELYIYSKDEIEIVEVYEKTAAQQFEEAYLRKPRRIQITGLLEEEVEQTKTLPVAAEEKQAVGISVKKPKIVRKLMKVKSGHSSLGPYSMLEQRLEIVDYLKKGRRCYEIGNYDRARKNVQNALSIDPDNSLAKRMLDRIYQAQGVQTEDDVHYINLERTIESMHKPAQEKISIGTKIKNYFVSGFKKFGAYFKKAKHAVAGFF